MNSNQTLIALLKKLLKLEEAARDLYSDYLKKVKNPELVRDLTIIRDQEISHVALAKQALEILGEPVD